jgi:nitrogen fixation protein NifU and related proteins
MGLHDLYQEIILDHYRKPRHPGRLEDAQVEVHHYNPVCGDELTVGLRLDGDRVAAVAVEGKGCSISQAAASVMTEQVLGRREGDPDEELLGDGIAFQGVARYPVRVKCALLGWMAFKDAAARAGTGGPGAQVAEGDSPRMDQGAEGTG